ncbi:Cof-type HAD-IIB family hydrolase [Virgibacillus sp. W0430]|uniref:Cof-type HAD-IIB family hydrolase n=1 Tax=Virgibacillus sp. W0430 TaxID=3391580 RepID=UPI003F470960
MRSKKHLIALDLDGTLLTDKKEISPQSRQTILRAIEMGHIVVIATGRSNRTSIQYYQQLGLVTPMVNFNGALIFNPKDRSWKAKHTPLENRTAMEIVDICYELNTKNILAEVQESVYLDKFDEQIVNVFQANLNARAPFTIGNIKNKLKENPTSLLIHPDTKSMHELRNHFSENHAEVIEHRQWGPPWHMIEVVKKGINKAEGLKSIAQYYDIPQERIIAFGDENNDLEMIDYAGIGVAMGNAIDELKSIAKHVTVSNEEHGVSLFLESYLKIKEKVL